MTPYIILVIAFTYVYKNVYKTQVDKAVEFFHIRLVSRVGKLILKLRGCEFQCVFIDHT